VLEEYNFSRFFSFKFSSILNNFIIFCKLNLVGFNHFRNLWFLCLFEGWQHLNQVDGDSKNIFGCNSYLFKFFGVVLYLSVQTNLTTIKWILILFQSYKPWLFNSLDGDLIFFLRILIWMINNLLLTSWEMASAIFSISLALR